MPVRSFRSIGSTPPVDCAGTVHVATDAEPGERRPFSDRSDRRLQQRWNGRPRHRHRWLLHTVARCGHPRPDRWDAGPQWLFGSLQRVSYRVRRAERLRRYPRHPYEAFLDLPLPAGAEITSVTANYRDINAGILFFQLVYVSSPGVTEVVVSSGPQLSVNNLTGLSLVMNPHPPVADTARYYLSALAGSGGVQQFCGAVVTCCAPVPAQPHASAAAHDEALWWLRLTSPSPNER